MGATLISTCDNGTGDVNADALANGWDDLEDAGNSVLAFDATARKRGARGAHFTMNDGDEISLVKNAMLGAGIELAEGETAYLGLWLNMPSAPASNGYMLAVYCAGAHSFSILDYTTGKLRAHLEDDNEAAFNSGYTADITGGWHWIVFEFTRATVGGDNGGCCIWVDGNRIADTEIAGKDNDSRTAGAPTLRVGAPMLATTDGFQLYFDDFVISDAYPDPPGAPGGVMLMGVGT